MAISRIGQSKMRLSQIRVMIFWRFSQRSCRVCWSRALALSKKLVWILYYYYRVVAHLSKSETEHLEKCPRSISRFTLYLWKKLNSNSNGARFKVTLTRPARASAAIDPIVRILKRVKNSRLLTRLCAIFIYAQSFIIYVMNHIHMRPKMLKIPGEI